MCGIVGYVGQREAAPILFEGLKRLEYRGYDSSGIGVLSANGRKINVRKTVGKIQNLLTQSYYRSVLICHNSGNRTTSSILRR